MTRASVWISLGCCLALLGCKKSDLVLVEGDVIVEGVHLGLVDVSFIPAEQMTAALAKKPFTLTQLPSAAFSVRSEADGTFFLKMKPGRYAVYAHGSEKAWLLWHTVGGSEARLLLSENNQVPFRCDDCIPIDVEPVKPPLLPPPPGPSAPFGSVPSAMQVMGSLDKKLIEKVIHANRGQPRYCWESQLMQNPSLHGKVAVKFVISPTGTVAMSTIAGSTAGNSQLEACLASRVKTWTFPKPKGGGVVIVTYPFVFEQVE